MINYFNTLTFQKKIEHLGQCRFMDHSEFSCAVDCLMNKKIVIVGCGAQGLNQGLNMRDSGLDIVYVLRKEAILEKNDSWRRATLHGFRLASYEEVIPEADLVINLTPDKQHSNVLRMLQPLMKSNSVLGYSHGFNIVEVGEKIRKDITVIMVAPKSPGSEVREEYMRGFGVPTLIAVHSENDLNEQGLMFAKGWAAAIGSDRAGVLESSFVAEVKSDLMGEQTVLCGLLQAGSLLSFNKMVDDGIDRMYAAKLVQFGWEIIAESLKHGGITLMMDRLSNTSKLRAFTLANKLKEIMLPLFEKHMNDIISGVFSHSMMLDWEDNDKKLLNWRHQVSNTMFESTPTCSEKISNQIYFDHGVLMVAMLKAGIELAFEIMIKVGIDPKSAYYESLHELPLIANTIARKKLYMMNKTISDTAEYGSYLFSNSLISLLQEDFIASLQQGDLGQSIIEKKVDNIQLRNVNDDIRSHSIEKIGAQLRLYMINMKDITKGR
ncbi:ketol-acid reductoisomerase [Blochmannia endosymbiont of Colobopsis nipponica]|uniref:ketol-acid reductoisomerase n=1 Tax=Blochmannia endosymbiont of Colobopsis nipponica TaxID=2681987 RepID=UPI00177C3948|nr:ketol-acid reductoisomerase [Blochmannia endosymbiont of Colobopsis nipponica]QOI10881.1 ketol-acid reductoisomerase [Blochmannia endosymbiont of Colobopsis nipponica]QOI10891.1 ketol-acid reductoisomerase [Blochmannia endosymbiont of Colobopsis nipponica]